jgi:hypothetical protein
MKSRGCLVGLIVIGYRNRPRYVGHGVYDSSSGWTSVALPGARWKPVSASADLCES